MVIVNMLIGVMGNALEKVRGSRSLLDLLPLRG
jgi:hypothetical protein